jgi:hypothetical protein
MDFAVTCTRRCIIMKLVMWKNSTEYGPVQNGRAGGSCPGGERGWMSLIRYQRYKDKLCMPTYKKRHNTSLAPNPTQ